MGMTRGLLLWWCPLATLVSLGGSLQAYEDELSSLLSPSLHHYDTLHPHTITHTLHGVLSHPHHSRVVEFHTLERHFRLFLTPHYRLFSPGFKVQLIDAGGTCQHHEIDRREYYHGYMGGEENSVVTAHISKSGIMTASVATSLETYHFEPSDNFIKGPHPYHMIAYRASDVKSRLDGSKFDYVVAPPLPPEEQTGTTSTHKSNNNADYRGIPSRGHQTAKRQSQGGTGRTSCPMMLVADYRFFNKFGVGGDTNESIAGITRRLITLVSQVDSMIYRKTVWIFDPLDNRTTAGLGLEIAGVLIHSESLGTSFNDRPHEYYNSRECCSDLIKGSLDADGLLSAFNFGDWSGYCLAHLFTFVDFDSGLLGLANIASSFRSQTGGICSEAFTDSSLQQRVIYNTGLSSFTSGGTPLIRGEQILVVGHEVGHNWGSHHDPNDRNCRDDYLMNEFAQDGSKGSHSRFSVCSRTSIGQVLRTKASCFVDADDCGDYMIGVMEECDEGPLGGRCCTANCELKDGSVCSDTNHHCCTNCQVASSKTVCDVAGSLTRDCRANISCNGVSVTCPAVNTSGQAEIGSPCLFGACQEQAVNFTVCVDFCTYENKETCSCPEKDQCRLCCKEEDGSCVANISLPTGTRCTGGSCIGGECRAVQDTISRIFDIIVNLDVNDLVLFMEENIVGFTIIFTLILWIPTTLLIHFCYDHRLWKKFKQYDNPDYVKLLEKLPLVQEYGELGSRSTSPIDDSPHPTYSHGGLYPVPEEDEEVESENENEDSKNNNPTAGLNTLV